MPARHDLLADLQLLIFQVATEYWIGSHFLSISPELALQMPIEHQFVVSLAVLLINQR